jgi:transglutaminase-like putative cysteine protease
MCVHSLLLFFVVILLFFISILLSSCSIDFSEDAMKPLANVIENNFSALIPSAIVDQGKITPPSGEELHEISSSHDLFFLLQESLYKFSPELYLSVDEYSQFSQYWEELTDEGALHSAFQKGQVQIEYENSSPCNIHLIFSYNATGSVMQSLLQSDTPVFETAEADELYTALMNVSDQIFKNEMSDFEKVVAAHDYLVVNSVYSVEGNVDYLATAHSVLIDGKGQCQGYSEAFAALLIISGVETRIISGMALDSTPVYQPHAWNLVSIDGSWYHVDATWDDPIPDTGGAAIHTYLCRSDTFFEMDHSWSDLFPFCPSDYPIEQHYEGSD